MTVQPPHSRCDCTVTLQSRYSRSAVNLQSMRRYCAVSVQSLSATATARSPHNCSVCWAVTSGRLYRKSLSGHYAVPATARWGYLHFLLTSSAMMSRHVSESWTTTPSLVLYLWVSIRSVTSARTFGSGALKSRANTIQLQALAGTSRTAVDPLQIESGST